MIFLPIRDTTYDQFSDIPPLDTAIKDLVFRIEPPLLEKVIQERLSYALREISQQKDKFVYLLPNNMKVECSRQEVSAYLKAIVHSLFQNTMFSRIIKGIAGRNIRKGLEIILDFCKSGHIGEDEIFKLKRSHGDYQLSNHVISKILFKGNRKFYDDSESNIKNLFHSNPDDNLPDPFLRLTILRWLKFKYKEKGPSRIQGYHKVMD